MKTETTTYPHLTLEKLSLLARRVRNYNITREDLELIDHYLTSAGSAGLVENCYRRNGMLSIDEALEVIQYRDNNFQDGYAASGLRGGLSGMIKSLTRRVNSGEEIY